MTNPADAERGDLRARFETLLAREESDDPMAYPDAIRALYEFSKDALVEVERLREALTEALKWLSWNEVPSVERYDRWRAALTQAGSENCPCGHSIREHARGGSGMCRVTECACRCAPAALAQAKQVQADV